MYVSGACRSVRSHCATLPSCYFVLAVHDVIALRALRSRVIAVIACIDPFSTPECSHTRLCKCATSRHREYTLYVCSLIYCAAFLFFLSTRAVCIVSLVTYSLHEMGSAAVCHLAASLHASFKASGHNCMGICAIAAGLSIPTHRGTAADARLGFRVMLECKLFFFQHQRTCLLTSVHTSTVSGKPV